MVQIVDGGSLTFDSLLYGPPHPGTQQFLSNQIQTVSTHLTDAGRQFMAGVNDMYERMSGSTAVRMLRAAGRSIRSMWQLDEIRALQTVGEFQNAPLVMQRWVMAEPTIRKMYQQQRCDGYSDTYIDVHPGTVGEEHYDYRRAVDGLYMVAETPDANGDHAATATTYFEELLPDDAELTLEEQVDIQDAWVWIKDLIRAGREDPTSRYNGDLN